MFGPKGQNKEGKCYKRHPAPCQKFEAGECDDKTCTYMHAAPVCTFFLKNKCQRKHCKFTHPKNKTETNKDKNGNHSNAHAVTNSSGHEASPQSFLEQITKLTKILEQQMKSTNKRMDQMEAKLTSST